MYPKSATLQAAVERFCMITVEFSTTTIEFLQKRARKSSCPNQPGVPN